MKTFCKKKLISMTVPVFFVLTANILFAQDRLKIGDPAPELKPYEWIKGNQIKEFKSGMVYVVEMGATWCGPCKVAIPKLTKLAKKYEGRVEVIGLFVQEVNNDPPGTPNPKYLDKVRKYVGQQGDNMGYSVGVDDPEGSIDKQWIKAIGKGRGVPQTFIIDRDGRLAAHFKGLNEDALNQTVESILAGSYLPTPAENEIPRFQHDKLLYVGGNGGKGDNFLFRSILAEASQNERYYRPSHIDAHALARRSKTFTQQFKDVLATVQVTNTPLVDLYFLAYHDTLENYPESRHPGYGKQYVDYEKFPEWKRAHPDYWHEPVIEVADDSLLRARWSYSLKVPEERASAAYLQKCMREDLDRYFGNHYVATLEVREMPCLFMKKREGYEQGLFPTRTPGKQFDSKEIILNGEPKLYLSNKDIRDVVKLLHHQYNWRTGKKKWSRIPIVDETKIDYEFDYIASLERKNPRGYTWEGYLDHLYNEVGLHVEKGTKLTKVVVIKDAKSQNTF